jgi:carboxylesterase
MPVFKSGNETGILLIHGFTSGPHEMKPLGDELAEEGYTISIPLLPGHGTTPEELGECTWMDWFSHVKQALFDLRKKCGVIIVVGQSMGGTLALHTAAHFQVEGVASLATGLILKEKKAKLLRIAAVFKQYRKKKNGPDLRDEAERIRLIPFSYNKTPLKAILQLKKLFEHVYLDLPEIYTPVLLIHSINDHVTDYRGSEDVYKEISSENKKILKLTDSYHVLTLDIEKQIVYREIKNFVKQIIDSSKD